MSKTIDDAKLAAFREAVLKKPDLTDDQALEILGETADVDAYHAALVEKYPEDFGTGEAPPQAAAKPPQAAAPAKAQTPPAKKQAQQRVEPKTPAAAPAAVRKVIFRNPDGSTTELKLMKETTSAIFVTAMPPKPKDLVTVIIKGTPVEIDLIELSELPGNTERHGLPVATLLAIGHAAKQ